jgi:ubiquinol-cytochrome c reductase iron-sulfur subunit
MSNEIQKFQDPGLPDHVHRKSDVDPKAADRAERQVAILFVLSALSTFLAIYAYIFIKDDIFFFLPIMGSTNAHQLFLGLGMAFSLLFIGLGMAHWAKNLMPDTEVIAERHEFRSPDEDREDFGVAL